MNPIRKKIDEFLSKDIKVSQYRQGLELIKASGVLEVIKMLGVPSVINGGSDLNAMAHEGSWSNGYNSSLNQLEFFIDFHDKPDGGAKASINPTFGGAAIAKREGYLSEEELKKVQAGQTKIGEKK